MKNKNEAIVLFSQSLTNDERDDLYYNEQYYRGPFNNLSWHEVWISINRITTKFPRRIKKEKQLDVEYANLTAGWYFEVPCNEKDSEGRRAKITIYVPSNLKNNFNNALECFLQKSGRSISKEVKNFITKIIETWYVRRDTVNNSPF